MVARRPGKRSWAEVVDADDQRRRQVQNQIEAINRLLVNGSYDEEMARLHSELAIAQQRISELESGAVWEWGTENPANGAGILWDSESDARQMGASVNHRIMRRRAAGEWEVTE